MVMTLLGLSCGLHLTLAASRRMEADKLAPQHATAEQAEKGVPYTSCKDDVPVHYDCLPCPYHHFHS